MDLSSIISNPEFAFVSVPESFVINDVSQIIYAPNGSGKTTLCRMLIAKYGDKCDLFSYDATQEPQYKNMNGKTKGMVINPMPVEYSSLDQQRAEIEKNISFDGPLSQLFGSKLKNKIASLTNDKAFLDIPKENLCLKTEPLTTEQRTGLGLLLTNKSDLLSILKKRETLLKIAEKDKKNDAKIIASTDQQAIFTVYDIDKHKKDIKDDGCPMCGRKDDKVFDDIKTTKAKIQSWKFSIFEGINCLRGIVGGDNVLNAIDGIVKAVNSLSDNQVRTLLITGGDKNAEATLDSNIKTHKELETKINKLITQRDKIYEDVKKAAPFIEKNIAYLPDAVSVKCDDKEKTIKFTTSRVLNSFSDGERHQIYSEIRELAVLGSDKEILLVDDPLTELDEANQYRIVFRFLDMASNFNKKVIIFTCNPSFINIAIQQRKNVFKNYYLDSKHDGESVSLSLLKLDLGPENDEPYLSLKRLYDICDQSKEKQILGLICERAKLDIENNHEDPRWDDISKLLHYDKKYTLIPENISNDELASKVETFTDFPDFVSFAELTLAKIVYLASIRVFIEKKLYLYDQERKAKSYSLCIDSNDRKTADKIIKVDKQKDFLVKLFYKNWNKKSLMCMKTMLNDTDHPFSQIHPMTYAMSISLDDLKKEILTVIDIFKI